MIILLTLTAAALNVSTGSEIAGDCFFSVSLIPFRRNRPGRMAQLRGFSLHQSETLCGKYFAHTLGRYIFFHAQGVRTASNLSIIY